MPINEKLFRLLIDNAMVGVYIVDEEQLFQYVNPALTDMLGYTSEEVIGTFRFPSFIHPDDIPLLVHHYQQRLSGEIPSARYEARALHKSGRVVNIEIYGTYVDINGKRSLAGTVIDITQRVTAEQALEELNRTLEQRIAAELALSREKDRMVMQQSRFAALGEMVAGIAHQWRQPLNMLGMSVQALQLAHGKGILTDEFMERHTEKSLEVLKYMSQTIDDFRNFFRPETAPRNFRLDEAVERVVVFFTSSVNTIAITTDVQNRVTMCGHMNELSQVMLNILNNARDALLEHQVEAPAIVVTVTRSETANLIRVSDNGGGIPDELIDRVFDPFFSTKDAAKGTGLGLYMVKSIVEKSMKGTIAVRNTGTGAEFTITLPFPGADGCGVEQKGEHA